MESTKKNNNSNNNTTNNKKNYKQRIEYYNEILTLCKFEPRSIHYLMLSVENTNTKSFRSLFDPLVKHGYLKRFDGNVFKNEFTITQTGLKFWEQLQDIMNHIKILNGGIGLLMKEDNNNREEEGKK